LIVEVYSEEGERLTSGETIVRVKAADAFSGAGTTRSTTYASISALTTYSTRAQKTGVGFARESDSAFPDAGQLRQKLRRVAKPQTVQAQVVFVEKRDAKIVLAGGSRPGVLRRPWAVFCRTVEKYKIQVDCFKNTQDHKEQSCFSSSRLRK
jgi:hypothetical protein